MLAYRARVGMPMALAVSPIGLTVSGLKHRGLGGGHRLAQAVITCYGKPSRKGSGRVVEATGLSAAPVLRSSCCILEEAWWEAD